MFDAQPSSGSSACLRKASAGASYSCVSTVERGASTMTLREYAECADAFEGARPAIPDLMARFVQHRSARIDQRCYPRGTNRSLPSTQMRRRWPPGSAPRQVSLRRRRGEFRHEASPAPCWRLATRRPLADALVDYRLEVEEEPRTYVIPDILISIYIIKYIDSSISCVRWTEVHRTCTLK